MIQNSGPTSSQSNNQLRKHVVMSLIQNLQNVTSDLRTGQATYLGVLKSRRENCDRVFDDFNAVNTNKGGEILASFLDKDLHVAPSMEVDYAGKPSQGLVIQDISLIFRIYTR